MQNSLKIGATLSFPFLRLGKWLNSKMREHHFLPKKSWVSSQLKKISPFKSDTISDLTRSIPVVPSRSGTDEAEGGSLSSDDSRTQARPFTPQAANSPSVHARFATQDPVSQVHWGMACEMSRDEEENSNQQSENDDETLQQVCSVMGSSLLGIFFLFFSFPFLLLFIHFFFLFI